MANCGESVWAPAMPSWTRPSKVPKRSTAPATALIKKPWKAFEASKALALKRLADTSATKVTLPFVEEQLKAARALMGADFWSYGVAPNRHVVEAFLRHHHAQGLSSRLVGVDEMFVPSTFEVAQL